jgi:hypothetical protein
LAAKLNLEDYILVTDRNRAMGVIMGRKLYVISVRKIIGMIYIRPRMEKGVLEAEGDPHFKSLKIVKEETMEEYISNFKPLIDSLILEKKLYIKQADKIIKYTVKT